MSPALWSFIEQKLFPPTHPSTDGTGRNRLVTRVRHVSHRPPGQAEGAQDAVPESSSTSCPPAWSLGHSASLCLFLFFLSLFFSLLFLKKKKKISILETCSIDIGLLFPLLRPDRKELMPLSGFSIVDPVSPALPWLYPFADSCDFFSLWVFQLCDSTDNKMALNYLLFVHTVFLSY